MRSLLIAALSGFLITVLLVFVLPKRWGHLRPILAALVGFLLAFVLSTYVLE